MFQNNTAIIFAIIIQIIARLCQYNNTYSSFE